MTEKEKKHKSICEFVERNFSNIPQDWVQIIAENLDAEIYAWPMWSTMWIVDNYFGKRLMEKSILIVNSEDCENHDKNKTCQACEDSEMEGAYCVTDKDGNTTNAFIYQIDGTYVLGINGARWNFYDGVWDRIYDALGLEWHKNHDENLTELLHHDDATICRNATSILKCLQRLNPAQ